MSQNHALNVNASNMRLNSKSATEEVRNWYKSKLQNGENIETKELTKKLKQAEKIDKAMENIDKPSFYRGFCDIVSKLAKISVGVTGAYFMYKLLSSAGIPEVTINIIMNHIIATAFNPGSIHIELICSHESTEALLAINEFPVVFFLEDGNSISLIIKVERSLTIPIDVSEEQFYETKEMVKKIPLTAIETHFGKWLKDNTYARDSTRICYICGRATGPLIEVPAGPGGMRTQPYCPNGHYASF